MQIMEQMTPSGSYLAIRFITIGAPTNANTFTVGYIANIAGTTKPGAYISNLTYTATANF
jgi:hypothetical protein